MGWGWANAVASWRRCAGGGVLCMLYLTASITVRSTAKSPAVPKHSLLCRAPRCAGPFYSEVLDEAQWNYCSPIPIAGLPELPDGIVRM